LEGTIVSLMFSPPLQTLREYVITFGGYRLADVLSFADPQGVRDHVWKETVVPLMFSSPFATLSLYVTMFERALSSR
jgi:hypothetical protein